MHNANHTPCVGRREFFSAAIAGAAVASLPSVAHAGAPAPQGGEIGVTDAHFAVGDVRRYGAKGDAKTDDTAAFNNAIRSVAALGGGEVAVPAGTFMIDPDHNRGKSIRLVSKVSLRGAGPGATVLQAIPGSIDTYSVVYVANADEVELSHFTARGERAGHSGTTGEFGHCVRIETSSHVTVRYVLATDGWGDGFNVGQSGPGTSRECANIEITHCFSENNRRCAYSVTAGRHVAIVDCVGAKTSGTAPECGIDVEPDGGKSPCADVLVSGCQFYGNHGFGMIQTGNGDNHAIRTTFASNFISDNAGGGIQVGGGVSGGVLAQNTITCTNPQQVGITQEFGPSVIIADNVISGALSYGIFVHGNMKPDQTGTSRISNNRISGAIQAGVCANNDAGRLALIGNEITACQVGLYLISVRNFAVTSNTIFGNTTFGAHIAHGQRGTIVGNIFQGNRGSGLFLEQCDAIAATGNAIHENAEHGLLMQRTSNCSATGNVVGENSQKANDAFHNVWISIGSDRNIVSGNVTYQGDASAKPHYGIRVDSGSHNMLEANLAQDGANGVSVAAPGKP